MNVKRTKATLESWHKVVRPYVKVPSPFLLGITTRHISEDILSQKGYSIILTLFLIINFKV
jgi:hypothetical protein